MVASVSDDEIRAFWRAHALGEIRSIQRTGGGARNHSAYVNDDLVVRFNTLDVDDAKFRNEALAYQLLSDSQLPVPDVILLDGSRAVVPYGALVVTRLPGVSLAESWRSFDPQSLEKVIRESGALLGRIHRHKLDGFGKLRQLDHQPFPSWFAYFEDYAHRYMSAAKELEIVDAMTMNRLQIILRVSQSLLERVTHGSLVHSDYHYENILQRDGRVSGLLDFEWALSGDPSYDFIAAQTRESIIPGSEQSFLRGYVSELGLDDEHDQRLLLYQLFFALEDSVDQTRQGNSARVEVAIEQLGHLLQLMA